MKPDQEHLSEEDALMKRNNRAPSFPASIVRSRLQLLVERFIQVGGFDIQEYIQSQRICKVDIDIPTLRDLYPGPNWKKDINKAVQFFMKIEGKEDADGNFDYTSLFSRAQLNSTGLHLNVDPEVLKLYIIRAGGSYTELDYNLTTFFKCAYTHEMYWQMCLHDIPSFDYRFFFTPEDINKKFHTKYQSSNIVSQIIIPTLNEIRELYEAGLSPRFFTYNERREVVGKCKKITGWEFYIHNEVRTKRQDIAGKEAYNKIDQFLRKYFNQYRMNILGQIRTWQSDGLIKLWMRLDKYDKDTTSQIQNPTAYLYFIFQKYGINPRSKKVNTKEIPNSPLFEKEEKDIATGLHYWMECLNHIKESPISNAIKELFCQLKFYDYSEKETESTLVFQCSNQIYETIETNFILDFQKVLLKYFPSNLKIYYNTNNEPRK